MKPNSIWMSTKLMRSACADMVTNVTNTAVVFTYCWICGARVAIGDERFVPENERAYVNSLDVPSTYRCRECAEKTK